MLLIEDDETLASILIDNLRDEGYEVAWTACGNEAVTRARAFVPDLIMLDVMLPDGSGFDLCGVLQQGRRVPIIMVTALSQKADKLTGLNAGADDYLTKPFDLDELLARVQAVLRRSWPSVEQVTLGNVQIDFVGMRAFHGSRELHLTHREFEILRYLAERHDRVVHREELLRNIWGYVDAPLSSTRSVDYSILRLRKKIEDDPRHSRFLRTVHGDGYCLTTSASS